MVPFFFILSSQQVDYKYMSEQMHYHAHLQYQSNAHDVNAALWFQ